MTRSGHLLFGAVTLLYWCSLYTYVPILSPYLLEELHIGAGAAGIILASYGIVQVVFRFAFGLWSDHLGKRKPFLLFGLLSGALSCLLFAVFMNAQGALAGRAVSGLSCSAWPMFTVLYASYYRPEETQKAMSNISFLLVSGQLIGMAVSGGLAQQAGSVATFWAGALAGLVGLVLVFGIKEPPPKADRPPMRLNDVAKAAGTASLWKVSLISICAHSVLFITMFGFTPSYASTELGVSRTALSWLSIAFMIPHATASLLSGRLVAPRFGVWRTIALGFAGSAVCTLSIPLTTSFGMLLATQALNGLMQGLHFPLFLSLCLQGIAKDKQATAMGLYQALYALGMSFGPFAAGWVNESAGLSAGFWLGSAIAGLAVAVTWLFARTWERKQTITNRG